VRDASQLVVDPNDVLFLPHYPVKGNAYNSPMVLTDLAASVENIL
jgi:hypothetical protein